MTTLDFLIELGATVVESFIYICTIAKLAGQKYTGKQWYWRVAAGVICDSALVTVMNQIETFSFATIFVVGIILVIYCKLFSRGSILVCLTAVMLSLMVMTAIDGFTFFAAGLVSENPITDSRSFMLLMMPGIVRTLYLAANKGVQLMLYLCFRKRFPDLRRLSAKYTVILLTVSFAALVLECSLLNVVLSDSLLIMQTAILFTFLFAVACVVIVLAASFLSLRYQSEKEQNRLLSTVNALTEENYQKLSVLQKELSKQNHDFTNHVRTLNGLLREEDAAEALRYTEVLLKAPLERTALCKSGNTIIDAVINSKIAEAEELSIEFRFQVNFALPTNISAVDICTILGNQIDNALEACQKVQDEKDRRIDVRIYQQANSVAVFQVSNTVESDPFENNEELKTTKTDSEKLHGLGIQNIRETAEKYQGILENSYQNGKFISSALLYFTSIATEEKS